MQYHVYSGFLEEFNYQIYSDNILAYLLVWQLKGIT